jgi:tRNA U34 5-carboxymethylaminomethyl modifying GTPase MnmE/TrmE
MHSICKRIINLGLFLFFTNIAIVYAEIPESIDPRAMAALSVEQRIHAQQDLDKALLKATPEERKVFWNRQHEIISGMTPQERKKMHEEYRNSWKSLSADQKEKVHQLRKEFYQSLSAQERQELKKIKHRHHKFGFHGHHSRCQDANQ